MLAQAWNADLAYQKGFVYGEEAGVYGVAGIYGPAANIHRSPSSGRNYEFYSEDGSRSGIMSSFNRIGTTPTAESSTLLNTV